MQRFEAHLENIHWEEDGEKLCETAPHDFHGMHFDRPLICVYWVSPLSSLEYPYLISWSQGKYGIFGIWEADDGDC